MDQNSLESALSGLPLGGIRYFPSTGSTNDEAARWSLEGCPNLSLVVADEQTAGRGRQGRTWITPAGSALAFSLVFLPPFDFESLMLGRFTALGAVAVREALLADYGFNAQIKWPNDVLMNNRKVCGVLAEAQWAGNNLMGVVLGVGINVLSESVSEPVLPAESLNFPATSVETALGKRVDRLSFLRSVLTYLLEWHPRLASPEFLQNWDDALAFRGEWVQILPGDSIGQAGEPVLQEGQILGLTPEGNLMLRSRTGETLTVRAGEIRLRKAL